mmetsp:Transcript_9703/g.41617  ORF Transcript_9703/g.41617 Transcript_9703/m.41617 type:complete len:115 (+) Transcript_9703:474-818(+)
MGVVVAEGDDVKVYEVTSRATKLPSWQKSATAKERRIRRLEEAKASAAGVQILQDFEMPSVSQKVRLSEVFFGGKSSSKWKPPKQLQAVLMPSHTQSFLESGLRFDGRTRTSCW